MAEYLTWIALPNDRQSRSLTSAYRRPILDVGIIMNSSMEAIFVVLFFAFLLILATSYDSRRRVQLKRSKAILDRSNPEPSKKPLGL
jgi:hypothetical protein